MADMEDSFRNQLGKLSKGDEVPYSTTSEVWYPCRKKNSTLDRQPPVRSNSSSRTGKPDRRATLRSCRTRWPNWENYCFSADFRSARGVIETTLYSRSLLSESSTCNNILSL